MMIVSRTFKFKILRNTFRTILKKCYFQFKRNSHLIMVKSRGEVCHLCQDKKQVKKAVCSIERCSLAFCFDCIRKSFDRKFSETSYKKEYWICFACGKKCKCNLCNGILPPERKKPIKKQNIEKQTPRYCSKTQLSERVESVKVEEVQPLISSKKLQNCLSSPTNNEKQTLGKTETVIQNKHLYRRFELFNFS